MNSHTTKCKACHARIQYVRTKAGRLMPTEASPTVNFKPGMSVINFSGEVIRIDQAGPRDKRLEGHDWYESHYAHCSAAGQFRRRR